MKRFHQTRRATSRRGMVYLAVLGVAMIVSIVAMSTMTIARLELKSTQHRRDLEAARLLSQSGVEFGLANMKTMSDWRSDVTSGQEITPSYQFTYGQLSYALVDNDGDLGDDTTDSVYILGIGRVGEAVYVTQAQLQPAGGGLTCLEASFCTDGTIEFDDATWTTDQFVSSNASGANAIRKAASGILNGNAEAVGTIQTGSITGTETEGISPRQMPDPNSVFDYYIANGTPIAASDIGSAIDRQVISPNSNPYGSTTNPLGIYVIDCQGGDIDIKDSRILGTIVLLNTGGGCRIDKDIHWEPFVANYPALMVQGDLETKWHGNHNLREHQLNVNFNPTGTPYQSVEDNDELDEYPPMIKGLVYVSGQMHVTHESIYDGVIVTGSVLAQDDLTITYDPSLLSNPPPGFTSGTDMQVVPGTWARIPY